MRLFKRKKCGGQFYNHNWNVLTCQHQGYFHLKYGDAKDPSTWSNPTTEVMVKCKDCGKIDYHNYSGHISRDVVDKIYAVNKYVG